MINPLYISQLILIALSLLTARRYGKMNHPATLLLIVVNLYACFLPPLGQSPTVQWALEMVIRG